MSFDFERLVWSIPDSQRAGRIRTLFACLVCLLDEQVMKNSDRKLLLEFMAGVEALSRLGYARDIAGQMDRVYIRCIAAGVPKEQLDALIALHLT